MRIGLDLHGVLDTEPGIFMGFCKVLMKSGAKVFVISGPPSDELKAELNRLGFVQGEHYTDVVSIVDYLKSKGVSMWAENGTWWANDDAWWGSKAEICKELNIRVMYDNTWRYKPYFDKVDKTEFVLWKSKS